MAVRRYSHDADLCGASVDPGRGDRGRRMRRRDRDGAILEDQAAAHPAGHRHHLDPHLRGQLQRVRPDLHGAGSVGRPQLRHGHPGHVPLSRLLRLPAPGRRSEHGRDDRNHDVPHHPCWRVRISVPHPDAPAALSVLRGADMSRATASLPRSIAAHAILIAYTVIALFPVILVIINSFKSRQAIFREPLMPPTSKTFDLVGYVTVMKQGDFLLYFQNSLIVTVASLFLVLLFGAMAAFALAEYRFRGNGLMGLYLALGIMIPIRLATVAI